MICPRSGVDVQDAGLVGSWKVCAFVFCFLLSYKESDFLYLSLSSLREFEPEDQLCLEFLSSVSVCCSICGWELHDDKLGDDAVISSLPLFLPPCSL